MKHSAILRPKGKTLKINFKKVLKKKKTKADNVPFFFPKSFLQMNKEKTLRTVSLCMFFVFFFCWCLVSWAPAAEVLCFKNK